MPDRVIVPLPVVAGLLSAEVGQDYDAGTVGDVARDLERVVCTVQTPSSSGSVVVEVRASGSLVATVTIPAGQRVAAVATPGTGVAALAALSVRVTDGGTGAQNLRGFLEIEGEVA